MLIQPRYLTKSRFKLALECPTKLFYTGKREYLNTSSEDSFLAALAEGGYQVGALACLMYPGGVMVDERTHAEQVKRTTQLLQQENVIIYEAALQADNLFVRVDILRKQGKLVELIEVKAKSFSSANRSFRGARGQIDSGFLPYLQDIAFQKYTAKLAFPDFDYRCFLMMADTSSVASVDGLNQRFRTRRVDGRIQVSVSAGTGATSLGDPILTALSVDELVAEILEGTITVGAEVLPFEAAVATLSDAYRLDQRIGVAPGPVCGGCEFKAPAPPQPGEPRSGFHDCWSTAFGWEADDFAGGTVLDIWNFKKKGALITEGIRQLGQVTQEHLGFDGQPPDATGMSIKHRQWYQCSGEWPDEGAFFLDRANLATVMTGWRYPLHFIDFETCTVPIPFTRGRRPYETIAFQFSHHTLDEMGRVVHRTQFLDATPGRNPNISFLRALRNALKDDEGTVLRWAAHENTVLTQLRRQLLADPQAPDDAADLIAFVDSITSRDDKAGGPRDMVDLCKLSEKYYFHPSTRGSSSLKRVLPALMASSALLKERYGKPSYGTSAMPSLNLSQPVAWWQTSGDRICDPYHLLPPVFAGLALEEQIAMEDELAPDLREGGAAMAAYASLQSEDLAPGVRKAMEAALLRYCELDTLAMAMAVQAWSAWIDGGKDPAPSIRG